MTDILDNKAFKENDSLLISRFRYCLGFSAEESISVAKPIPGLYQFKEDIFDWFDEQGDYTFLEDWAASSRPGVTNNKNKGYAVMFYFKEKELLLKFILAWG